MPDANTVALNLAAKLTDGQQIYVLRVGEAMPATLGTSGAGNVSSTGPLVNINTATEEEMKEKLNVAASTAQKIITYRTEHGSYTAINQLSEVISQSIYDRIREMITI